MREVIRSVRRVSMIASVGILFVLALAVAQPAAAKGISPAQLGEAGWGCLFVLGAVHCAPSGALKHFVDGTAGTVTFLVFQTEDPTADDAPFLGTEIIIHHGLFHGQPCPTDPPSREYTDLMPLIGLPYFACHHYDSSF